MRKKRVLTFALLGAVIGYAFFSPIAMVIADRTHATLSPAYLKKMSESVVISLTEVFRPEFFLWAISHILMGGLIGAIIGFFFGRVERDKEKIEDQKNKLNVILSHMAEGVVIINKDYEIEFLNDAFEERLGDLRGQKCYRVLKGLEKVCEHCPIEEIVKRGEKKYSFATELIDGSSFEVVATPLKNPNGSSSVMKIARDTSERKKIEKQLIQTEKLASLGQMAAGIAHQIGNPLASLSGIAQVLSMDGTFEEAEKKDYLQAMLRLVEQIDRTMRNLLDFSRPSRENEEPIAINDFIEEVLRFSVQHPKISKISIRKSLRENLPAIHADRELLTQAFFNIILNAAEAMTREGILEIGTSLQEENRVGISFSDTGSGIAEENLSKIFDPFFTTKPVGQGTGLGLSVSYRIVEKYHGEIEVKSKLNEGTTFTITLPSDRENSHEE